MVFLSSHSILKKAATEGYETMAKALEHQRLREYRFKLLIPTLSLVILAFSAAIIGITMHEIKATHYRKGDIALRSVSESMVAVMNEAIYSCQYTSPWYMDDKSMSLEEKDRHLNKLQQLTLVKMKITSQWSDKGCSGCEPFFNIIQYSDFLTLQENIRRRSLTPEMTNEEYISALLRLETAIAYYLGTSISDVIAHLLWLEDITNAGFIASMAVHAWHGVAGNAALDTLGFNMSSLASYTITRTQKSVAVLNPFLENAQTNTIQKLTPFKTMLQNITSPITGDFDKLKVMGETSVEEFITILEDKFLETINVISGSHTFNTKQGLKLIIRIVFAGIIIISLLIADGMMMRDICVLVFATDEGMLQLQEVERLDSSLERMNEFINYIYNFDVAGMRAAVEASLNNPSHTSAESDLIKLESSLEQVFSYVSPCLLNCRASTTESQSKYSYNNNGRSKNNNNGTHGDDMNNDFYDNDDNIDTQGKNKHKNKRRKNNNNYNNNELALMPANPLMNHGDTKSAISLPMESYPFENNNNTNQHHTVMHNFKQRFLSFRAHKGKHANGGKATNNFNNGEEMTQLINAQSLHLPGRNKDMVNDNAMMMMMKYDNEDWIDDDKARNVDDSVFIKSIDVIPVKLEYRNVCILIADTSNTFFSRVTADTAKVLPKLAESFISSICTEARGMGGTLIGMSGTLLMIGWNISNQGEESAIGSNRHKCKNVNARGFQEIEPESAAVTVLLRIREKLAKTHPNVRYAVISSSIPQGVIGTDSLRSYILAGPILLMGRLLLMVARLHSVHCVIDSASALHVDHPLVQKRALEKVSLNMNVIGIPGCDTIVFEITLTNNAERDKMVMWNAAFDALHANLCDEARKKMHAWEAHYGITESSTRFMQMLNAEPVPRLRTYLVDNAEALDMCRLL